MKALLTLGLAFFLVTPALAGRLPESDSAPAASTTSFDPGSHTGEQKMKRRFGIGFEAAGPLSVFGISADFNISEQFDVAVGFGTGVDYTTWMAEARYFLFDHWISPFIGVGVARWWTDGTREKNLGPRVLATNLLRADENPEHGFSAFLLYPAVGVQLFHKAGFAASFEIEQLFRLFSFGNATYGGLSFHYYL